MRSFATVVVVALLTSAPDTTAESSVGIRLEKRQTVTYRSNRFWLRYMVSVSGRVVAVHNSDRQKWEFFELTGDDEWQGPHVWDDAGLTYQEQVSFEWRTDSAGGDVFWKAEPPHQGVRVSDGDITVTQNVAPAQVSLPTVETLTGRLTRRQHLDEIREGTIAEDTVAKMDEILTSLAKEYSDRYKSGTFNKGRVSIHDISPARDAILAYDNSAYLSTIQSIDLRDQTRTEFWPHGHAKCFDRGAYGQYSADGRFVLVNFGYRDDSNQFEMISDDGQLVGRPGCMQVFDRTGAFVAEVFVHEYREDGPVLYGSGRWLPDDWIVYTSPYDLVFVKVIKGK